MKIYMRTREVDEENGEDYGLAMLLIDEDANIAIDGNHVWFYTTKKIIRECLREGDIILIGEL